MKIANKILQILPLVFWMLVMLAFDSASAAILTLLSALIHEGGHLIAIKPYKRGVPRADISGFKIDTGRLSYKEELIGALGGPLANILLSLILFIPFEISPELAYYIKLFALINLMSGISNLFPLMGYDGYKIIYCAVILAANDALRAERAVIRVSFLFSTLLTFCSLYLLLRLGEGYWLFALCFSLTLSTVIKGQKHTIYEN